VPRMVRFPIATTRSGGSLVASTMSASEPSLMESLAQGAAKVPLGIRGRLIEAEGSRISTPCDTRQQNEAMDSLVVDAEANMRVRKLGGHLSGHLG